MNQYEKQYLEKKNAVLKCLTDGKEFLNTNGYEHEAEMIQQQIQNVQNGEFSIVLVGEFSAGKSTFLNALMGEKILPSYSDETTATVNLLQHKSKAEHGESGCVYYHDGTTKEIQNADLETISRYVTTRSDSEKVAQDIKHLTLYLDSKFLENNVTLVDSPGLNGVADGHREITMEQIEKSSASIFLFNAQQPGKRSDFDFLSDLRKRVNSIIFVLNKIDNIKQHEGETVESVIEKLKENYKNFYNETTIPEIWPISAYSALDARNSTPLDPSMKPYTAEHKEALEEASRMRAFENRLWKFLTQGEKAKSLLSAPIQQLISQLSDVKERIKAEQDVLSGQIDTSEIEAQKLSLEQQRETLKETLAARRRDLTEELKVAVSETKEYINAETEYLRTSYLKKLDNWQDIDEIEPDRIQSDILRRLTKIAEDAVMQFQESVGTIILEYENSTIDAINSKMPESTFSFGLTRRIELPEITLGLEEYDAAIETMEQELKELEVQAEKAQDDFSQALEIQNRKLNVKRELDARKATRENYITASQQCIPDKRYREEVRYEKQWRHGGIGGLLEFLVLGRKEEQRIDTIIDSSERDEYLRERSKRISDFDAEIKKLEEELHSCGSASTEMYQRKEAQIEQKRQAKQDDLRRMREEFKKKSEKKIAVGLQKAKRDVGDFIEENTAVFLKALLKELKKLNDATAQVILDIVAANVTAQIDSRNRQIMQLEEKMNLAVNEKTEKEAAMQKTLDQLKDILATSYDISDEIESIQTDEIAQIAI